MPLKIALIGRPNVGKSALFNRIANRRISIVDEEEGITRDRIYAEAELFGRPFVLIDTGGIDPRSTAPFNAEIRRQSLVAIEEADGLIFVVDGQVGPTLLDGELAALIRSKNKPVVVAVNKIDKLADDPLTHAFHELGIPSLIGVSAVQGYQIAEMLETLFSRLPLDDGTAPESPPLPTSSMGETTQGGPIRLAIVGRPNVGKSTLLNQLIGADRSIVSPIAGTTRDAIDVPLSVGGKEYLLIDTAGIRRKKSEKAVVDKFAAVRTKEAIQRADICLLVLDAHDGFTTQERRIAADIEELGKGCVLLFNKWDLVKQLRMEHALRGIREIAPFLSHCPAIFLSALRKRNLDKIFPAVDEVHSDRGRRISTGSLNTFIERCLQKYHPPLITGKRLRIYYMTQVESNPPKFVLFVNYPELLTDTYKKYLINQFREEFRFSGTPLQFELRGKTAPSAEPALL
jgi:GTP-binding protein